MIVSIYRTVAALFALSLLLLPVPPARAQAPAVDPDTVQILQRMTDYLGSIQAFSVHTQNTLEDELDSGHRVDVDVSASVTISRPNRLHAERRGELVEQVFSYDGKTLTLYNPSEKVYASEPAPGTIEDSLYRFT